MVLSKLKKIINDVLNIDESEVNEDTTFVEDLGADSLDVYQIAMEVEEVFDIEISKEAVDGIHTVGDALKLIEELIGD